jgi:hypothetical protein
MEQIEQRMARLEKSLQAYRVLLASILVLGGTMAILSHSSKTASVPDLIKAKAFQVVDDNGNALVEINKEKGNGQISTYTPGGTRLVTLFTSDGGAGAINTFDKDGHVNFKVTRTTEGGGYMALFNNEEKEVAEWGVTTAESGYFKLNDKYGEKIAWMTFTNNGGGYLSLLNGGKETIRLSTPEAGGRMGIYNGSATRIGFMGSQDNGDGNITIYNSTGSRTGGVPN